MPSVSVHPSNRSEVAWTSWLPALAHALGGSVGPILEIGIGHFSTPFLHEYAKVSDRRLVSVEADDAWRAGFAHLVSPGHAFASDWRAFTNQPWGVVFIDNSPGGIARSEPFSSFIGKSRFVVVHDYHRENEEAIKPLLSGVAHHVYADYDPPTLLAEGRF